MKLLLIGVVAFAAWCYGAVQLWPWLRARLRGESYEMDRPTFLKVVGAGVFFFVLLRVSL